MPSSSGVTLQCFDEKLMIENCDFADASVLLEGLDHNNGMKEALIACVRCEHSECCCLVVRMRYKTDV